MDSKLICVLLVCCVAWSSALSCRGPCDKVHCQQPDDCAGGLTKDACGCCDKCAKQVGEKCGGSWGMFLKCDQGLVCKKVHKFFGRCQAKEEEIVDDIGKVCGLVCMIYCPYGNVMDHRGCPICKCKSKPTTPTFPRCGPTCMIHCLHGRIMDSRGCPTCTCKKAPLF